jgi:hypothetical protein
MSLALRAAIMAAEGTSPQLKARLKIQPGHTPDEYRKIAREVALTY